MLPLRQTADHSEMGVSTSGVLEVVVDESLFGVCLER